jgi:hypothetical protein
VTTCPECGNQVDPGDATRLARLLLAEPWLRDALDAVARSGLPQAWIGAGAVRDVVWGRFGGGFRVESVRDVDVAFFDPHDLSPGRDAAAQRRLAGIVDLPWEASNQAAVHTWYHRHFGGSPVPPLASVHQAVATWPETASAVAVRRTRAGVEVCAPYGLDDLFGRVLRGNLVRVAPEHSRARLARLHERWPHTTVVPV